MEFGIQKTQMSAWLDIQMLTRSGALMIGKALPVVVSILEITWSHGLAKSKIQSLFQRLKLNILQLGVVVHNYYR